MSQPQSTVMQADLWSSSYNANISSVATTVGAEPAASIVHVQEIDATTIAQLKAVLDNVTITETVLIPNSIIHSPTTAISENVLVHPVKEENTQDDKVLVPDGLGNINPHHFPTRMSMDDMLKLNNMSLHSQISIPKQSVFERIKAREKRLFEDLRIANGRLAELTILKNYPLNPEEMYRNTNEVTNHFEPPTPELFRKLDTASEADRRAFAANLLNDSQIHHLLRCYELRYLCPVGYVVPKEDKKEEKDNDATTPSLISNELLSLDSQQQQSVTQPDAQVINPDPSEVLEKVIEFLARYQWCGGGIYIDDDTWGVHPKDADKPDGDYCLSNTMDQDNLKNPSLEKYMDDFCYLVERFYPTIDVSYKTHHIKKSNRVLVVFHFNLKTVIEERRKNNKEENDESSDDDSDEEDVVNDESSSDSESE